MTTNRSMLLLLLALALLAPVVSGAQTEGGDAAPEPIPEEPAPPTLSEIANLAQEQGAILLAVESRLQSDPETETVLERLAATAAAREAREEEITTALEERSSIYRLRKLREESAALRRQLEEWVAQLDVRFDERSRDLEATKSGRDELVQVTERVPDLPSALVAEIDSLQARAAEIEPRLTERLNTLVDAQARAAKEKTAVADWIKRLDGAQERATEALLERDSPRLWNALDPDPTADQAEPTSLEHLRELRAYASTHQNLVVVHALLIAALAVLLTTLQRSARRGEEVDPGLSQAADALGNPLSAALVLGLLPTYWIHPLAARGLVLVSYLVISVPLVYLLHQHLSAVLRPAARALVAAVMLFFAIEFATGELTFAHRIGVLAVTGIGAVAFARVQRPGVVNEAIANPRLRGMFVLATRVGSAALLGAALANILGYTRLADLLSRSTISSTYFGLLTFVGALLIRAFVDLSLRSRFLQSLRIVRNRTGLFSRRLKGFANAAAVVFWVLVVLIITQLFQPLRRLAAGILSEPLSIGDIQVSLGDLVAFGLTFWVALLIARFVRFTLEEGVLPALSLPRGVPATVSKLTGYTIVTLGFMIALGAAGFPLDRLTFMAGAFGLGLGFGLQNLIANFVSGLILLIERPIQVGDTIEFGTRTGRVTRIGIRSSVVRTWDGAEVNVPNGELVSREVVNWTMSDAMRRLQIPVGVAYGTDPDKIPEILLPAATEHEGIVDDPAPEVLFLGFGESSLDFELRCWTSSPDWWRYRSEITFAVHHRLKEAGVEIPFPQRDLHLRSSSVAAIPVKPETADPG